MRAGEQHTGREGAAQQCALQGQFSRSPRRVSVLGVILRTMTCTASLTLSTGELDRLAAQGAEAILDGEGYFGCDLAASHPGRHVALVDVLVLDRKLPVTTHWLWWQADGHGLTLGPSCERCPLPVHHPAGSGCSGARAALCASTVEITSSEADRLDGLPEGVHQVETTLTCQYVLGHTGQHVALAQSQDHDIDTSTAWWVVWPRDGEGYRIEVMDECPAASEEGLCKHPVGHLGDHWL